MTCLSTIPSASKLSSGALRLLLTAALLGGLGQSAFSSSAFAPSGATPAQDAATNVERYVTAGATGASLYNLPDPKGQVVLKAEAGTPLAVLGSKVQGRYLKVAAPGGLKVWVFGKYLVESDRLGWVELTGSYVNMRPLPRSQNSYPLGQLDKGDRLLFVKRNDLSKPMAEDWVQVYSPPGTAAYVLAAETTAVATGTDGAKLWAAASSAALASRSTHIAAPEPKLAAATDSGAKGGTAVEAGSTDALGSAAEQGGEPVTTQAPPRDFFEAVHRADALMDGEMGSPNPDYLAMIAAYETVLAMNPDAPTRHLVERRMNEISLSQELASLKLQAAGERAQRERELRNLRQKIATLSTESDPLWGRFVARGWLESKTVKGQQVYRIRFGSEYIAEVQCLSGRYDLSQYTNFEIGVRGMSIGNSNRELTAVPVIDIDRIEVISARLAR